jgi:SHS family sialic acid transporter-like MFS transporter
MTATATPASPAPPVALSTTGRYLVLVVAFLGWFFAGGHMAITQQIGRAASIDLLGQTGAIDASLFQQLSRNKDRSEADRQQLEAWEGPVGRWFAWMQCAFLFGAAAGGLLFGWIGDGIGRAKGMSLSILTYSAFAGAAYFAQTPLQLALLWFLACLGVGGMWPNGVALVSEAWSNLSRPFVAGVIGTSANVGIFLFSTLAKHKTIDPSDWRWTLLVGASPLLLGIFGLLLVPESPRWQAARRQPA